MLVGKARFELPWTVSRLIGPPPSAMCKPGKGSSRGSPGGQVSYSKRPAANGFVALPKIEPIRFDWRIVRERNFYLLFSSSNHLYYLYSHYLVHAWTSFIWSVLTELVLTLKGPSIAWWPFVVLLSRDLVLSPLKKTLHTRRLLVEVRVIHRISSSSFFFF